MATISFSGIASGIDGDAVIKSILDARRLATVPLENKVENNKKETTALEEFNTKLLLLNDQLKSFLTASGSAVSKTAVSSNEDALTASAVSGAPVQSATLEVLNLAKGASLAFGDHFSAVDQPVFAGLSGSAVIQLTVGSGDSAQVFDIEVNAQTTLSDLVAQINDKAEGKATASVINVGSSGGEAQYVLSLNSTRSGVKDGTLSVTIPPEISSLGLLQNPTLEQAEDAVVKMAGVGEIIRPDNDISDIIPGVTLHLTQENTGPITVSVRTDADKTAKNVTDMIAALNDVIAYSRDNGKIERVEDDETVTNKFGTLARTRVDNQVIDAIKRALASAKVEGNGVSSFADLGVATQRDGSLKFDEKQFEEALAKDPAAVNSLLQKFGDAVGAANGVIWEYTKFQGGISQAIAANDQENESLNDRLSRLDKILEQQQESLKKVFAQLESTLGGLNSQSQALAQILAGITPVTSS